MSVPVTPRPTWEAELLRDAVFAMEHAEIALIAFVPWCDLALVERDRARLQEVRERVAAAVETLPHPSGGDEGGDAVSVRQSTCAAAGLSPASCSGIAEDGELCRYHQGVEDAALTLTAALDALGVDVYVTERLDVACRMEVSATGEVLEGRVGSLVRYMAASLDAGNAFSVEPRVEVTA